MNSQDYPIISLELRGMKSAIIHHMITYRDELNEAVEQELDKAIAAFDFQGRVRDAINRGITDCINFYFQHGEGRKAIEEAVTTAVKEVFE